jgi:P-type Cu2+ transporter
MKNERLHVTGMTCTACAGSIESFLKHEPGIQEVSVNYANATVQLIYDEEQISLKTIAEIVADLGYNLILPNPKADEEAELAQSIRFKRLQWNTFGAMLFAVPLFILGMFFMHWHPGHWISWGLATPLLTLFGRQFFINAFKQAMKGTSSMDTLVALSTGIAYLYSAFNLLFPDFLRARGIEPHLYFEASGIIIAFILLGKYLEERAKYVSSEAIKQLIELQPDNVLIIKDNKEEFIPIDQVKEGMWIRIRPGDRIPVDGIIESGESYLDESSVTGEPLPVWKKSGDPVISGTLNQQGSFIFCATRVGEETFLAQIIETVRQAQGSKAPVQRLVDKISSVFVPTVIALALLSALLWWILADEHAFVLGLNALITVLVIACPCALGLATPTGIVTAVGHAAKKGIIVKDAMALERLGQVTDIIVDKTGTLTEGKPIVREFVFRDSTLPADLAVWLSMEKQSEHPLSTAISSFYSKEFPLVTEVTLNQFTSQTGKGLRADHNGDTYHILSLSGALELAQTETEEMVAHFSKDPGTIVVFLKNQQPHALLLIQDALKPTSQEAVSWFLQHDIRVHMLTGDNAQNAKHVAKQLGITHFRGECMPQDKGAYIRDLQSNGKIVAMVGDGSNDSEALALSDVSIAMGKGADIAKNVAKMTLLNSDLNSIGQGIQLSQKTGRIIRQNLFWAFFYNVISIPVAAGLLIPVNGFMLNPMLAGGAMALSSVSVVLNSLRLRYSA